MDDTSGEANGRREPLVGIHEIVTGQPDADMCVDLLVAFFAADRELDPGKGVPLALRLAAIGPSVVDDQPANHFTRPLVYGPGNEHVVNGERVRFFDGARGADRRYAYVVDAPNRNIGYYPAHGGWTDRIEPPVLGRVFGDLMARIETLARSELRLEWRSSSTGDDEVAEVSGEGVLERYCSSPLLLIDECEGPYLNPGQLESLFVGPNVVVRIRSELLWVTGPDDEAIRATALAELDGVGNFKANFARSSDPFSDDDGLPSPESISAWLVELPATLPLSRLDSVEWSRLGHAYGSAADVPSMLLSLGQSDVGGEVPDGLDDLYGSVAHQGSIYSSTPFVVPFLGGMLEDRIDLRPELLAYLSFITLDWQQGSVFPEVPTPNPRSLPEGWVFRTVGRLWPLLARLTESDDPAVARCAVQILSRLPDQAHESFERLGELNPQNEVAPAVAVAMGVLGRTIGADSSLLPGAPDSAPDDVTLGWAIARCLLGSESAADAVIEHLGVEFTPPIFDTETPRLALLSLLTIEGWPSLPDFERVLASLSEDERSVPLETVGRRVLPHGLPARIDQLDGFQKRFVEEVVHFANNEPHGAMSLEQFERFLGGDFSQPEVTKRRRHLNFQLAVGMSEIAFQRYLVGAFDPTI